MLTITDKASQVLREVTGHPRLAETSGLRIARKHPASDSLGVKAVSAPEPGDTVVEQIFREVRAFRIYDGPTEVHKWSLARKIKRDWMETQP